MDFDPVCVIAIGISEPVFVIGNELVKHKRHCLDVDANSDLRRRVGSGIANCCQRIGGCLGRRRDDTAGHVGHRANAVSDRRKIRAQDFPR